MHETLPRTFFCPSLVYETSTLAVRNIYIYETLFLYIFLHQFITLYHKFVDYDFANYYITTLPYHYLDILHVFFYILYAI